MIRLQSSSELQGITKQKGLTDLQGMMLLWMSCYLQQKQSVEFHSWSLNIIGVLNPVSCSLWGLNKSLLLPKANDSLEMHMPPIFSSGAKTSPPCFRVKREAVLATILSLPLSLTLPQPESYLTINTSSLKSDCIGHNELEVEALLVSISDIRSPRGFQLNSNPDCLLSHTP